MKKNKDAARTAVIVVCALALAIGLTWLRRRCDDRLDEVTAVVVLAKQDTDEGELLVLGKDDVELAARHSRYVSDVFFGTDTVWYSVDDGASYQALSLKGLTAVAGFSGVDGQIMYATAAGYLANGTDDTSVRYDAASGRRYDADTYIVAVAAQDDVLYVLTGDDVIERYSLPGLQPLGQYAVGDGQGYMALTVVDGTVYYVTQAGYTSLGADNPVTTYLFPVPFSSIAYVNGPYLGLSDGATVARYVVALGGYSMTLTADAGGQDVDFSSRLTGWYGRGFTAEHYHEYQ